MLFTLGLSSQCSAQAQAGLPAQHSIEFTSTSMSDAEGLPDAPDRAYLATTRRRVLAAQAGNLASAPGLAASFPDAAERRRRYLADVLGPRAFIAAAFQSASDTARPLKVAYPSDGFIAPGEHPAHGSVPEWGEGAQGYAKRYADRFGQGLIGTTTRYALGEALRQDVSYHRCACTGLLPRTGHALASAYLAHTRADRTVVSLPALVSPFVASQVAVAAWYPGRFNTSDALRISLPNYLAAPIKNLLGEFLGK